VPSKYNPQQQVWKRTRLFRRARECRNVSHACRDNCQRRSILVASQLPVANWHEYLGNSTLADAILDRLVHNTHTITLKGESMRRRHNPLQTNQKKSTTETK